jgi:hypothetical protein
MSEGQKVEGRQEIREAPGKVYLDVGPDIFPSFALYKIPLRKNDVYVSLHKNSKEADRSKDYIDLMDTEKQAKKFLVTKETIGEVLGEGTVDQVILSDVLDSDPHDDPLLDRPPGYQAEVFKSFWELINLCHKYLKINGSMRIYQTRTVVLPEVYEELINSLKNNSRFAFSEDAEERKRIIEIPGVVMALTIKVYKLTKIK